MFIHYQSLLHRYDCIIITNNLLLLHSISNSTITWWVNIIATIMLTYVSMYVSLPFTVIIRPPVNQSACEGGTLNFTCVVMFISGPLGAATWVTNNGIIDATALPDHTRTDDSNGRSAPASVTNVLTVTNVNISDNGTDYFCVQGFNARSDTVFLTVFGEFNLHMHYLNLFMQLLIYICSYMCKCMCIQMI